MGVRGLLIAYALVNAVLYSILLPLWEGFDEPFHFAYVQQLANGQGLPDARTARLSREVEASILLAPASEGVKQNLPHVTSFTEYFSWPIAKRSVVRRQLRAIPTELRWHFQENSLNYEAQHPPLAYILLAFPERLLASRSLPMRVALLRIMAAIGGALLLFNGAERLFAQLSIPEPYQSVALFCLLSCQMTWATLAHIANDWLAVPIAVWTLVALNRFRESPSLRSAVWAAVVLAVGLVTKAYFLAFVPLFIGLFAWRWRWRELALASAIVCGLAGPWYARNLFRYGVLSGTQESRAGTGLTTVLSAAPALNWPAMIWSNLRGALWTGNNTFSSFSLSTINLTIGIGLLALLLWAATSHGSTEWITVSFCVLFALALGYQTVVTHIYTHGAANGPSAWYMQVLSAPLLGLALLGASRRPRIGRFVTALLVLLFGYVLAATYVVKLIPLYGGYEGRTSLAGLTFLYSHQLGALAANLDSVTLAPAVVVFALSGIVIVLVIAQQILLLRRQLGSLS